MRKAKTGLYKYAAALGRMIPEPHRRNLKDFLFPKRRDLVIDVVGSCTLACPSCPVGNMGPINPRGRMDLDLFTKIVDKANKEYDINGVGLFNWTEPLIHNQITDMIKIVKDRGLFVSISSNLNFLPDPEKLMASRPDYFRISLSGFTQEVYGKTHFKGNIEKVKANMALLSEAKRKVGNTETNVDVYFHKYLKNLHELPLMKSYAESLGFNFSADWAYFMPLEKAIALGDGTIEEKDRSFIENELALPIEEALRLAKKQKERKCWLMGGQIVVDVKGDLQLCCASYDAKEVGMGSYLDLTPKQIEKAKATHPFCNKCMKEGAHVYVDYFSDDKLRAVYHQLAEENVKSHSQSAKE